MVEGFPRLGELLHRQIRRRSCTALEHDVYSWRSGNCKDWADQRRWLHEVRACLPVSAITASDQAEALRALHRRCW